jgi:hypothetical protein
VQSTKELLEVKLAVAGQVVGGDALICTWTADRYQPLSPTVPLTIV